MKALVACEFSGTVRDALLAEGFDAWSCDILPDERGSNRHIRGDARDILADGWDLLIVAHPPCTRLCNSGVRWLTKPPAGKSLEDMWRELNEGAALFSTFWNAPIKRKCLENPVMHRHAKERIINYRRPAQSFQPWPFGDWESKRTCFWLDNLQPLKPDYPTLDDARAALGLPSDAKPTQRVFRMPAGPERAKERSRFFPGAARALAQQFGAQIRRTT